MMNPLQATSIEKPPLYSIEEIKTSIISRFHRIMWTKPEDISDTCRGDISFKLVCWCFTQTPLPYSLTSLLRNLEKQAQNSLFCTCRFTAAYQVLSCNHLFNDCSETSCWCLCRFVAGKLLRHFTKISLLQNVASTLHLHLPGSSFQIWKTSISTNTSLSILWSDRKSTFI